MKKYLRYVRPSLWISMLFLIFSGAACNLSEIINPDKKDPVAFRSEDVNAAIVGVINQLSYYAIYVAIIFFIYGGISYIISVGNDEKITKAKSVLTWSVVGLIVILASYAFTKYLLEQITG